MRPKFLALVAFVDPETNLASVWEHQFDRMPTPQMVRLCFTGGITAPQEEMDYCVSRGALYYKLWHHVSDSPVLQMNPLVSPDLFFLLPKRYYHPVCRNCADVFVPAVDMLCSACDRPSPATVEEVN